MELLRDTNFDFMKYRKFWVVVSLALVGIGIFSVFFHGKLNVGVDFAGGTQMTFKFRENPDVGKLRALIEAQGMPDPLVQTYGEAGDNEVLVKTRLVEGSAEASRDRVLAALDKEYNPGQTGKPDLNRIGVEAVTGILLAADPDGVRGQGDDAARAHYEDAAEAVLGKRRADGLFTSWDNLAGLPGLSPAALQTLRGATSIGNFSVLGVESVGPQIGEELRQRGLMAVLLSMLGMLAYIWFRFELRFGIGAIMACLHDVIVTLGLYALAGFEFNLTTIAAFLTLIGYSVNDTVVIFDRIRENMRKSRRKPLIDIMNESINQTLSRTILTGGATLLALLALLIWGGPVIRGFAFVMFVGILVGTYSSIYVASPFALVWENYFGNRGRRIQGAEAPATAAEGRRSETKPARKAS